MAAAKAGAFPGRNGQSGLTVERNKRDTGIEAGVDHRKTGRHGLNLHDSKSFAARHRRQREQIGRVIVRRHAGVVDFTGEDHLVRHSQPRGETLQFSTQRTVAHDHQLAAHRRHGADQNFEAFVIHQAARR